MKSTFMALAATLLMSITAGAQIDENYEVATWGGFKTSAVSYTFDDNTGNQLPVALPLFDQYDFKVTLYTVTNWGPDWTALRKASDNGHEVASHTISHPSLPSISVEEQETQLQQSQSTIRSNVPNAEVLTIAYPNCNIGDLATIEKYYIAGRICSGQIIPAKPGDYYRLSAMIVGSQGGVNSASAFQTKVESAKSSGGWAVFLIHGIDNDGGYSPVSSAVLSDHVDFMNANSDDYWVGTFAEVVKYIKERESVSIAESSITDDSLKVTISDDLDDALYNQAISVRRKLPSNWRTASVYIDGEAIQSHIQSENGISYVVFDAVPDHGIITIGSASGAAQVLSAHDEAKITFHPNPFRDRIRVSFPGAFRYTVYSLTGHQVHSGEASNSTLIGEHLPAGTYIIKVMSQSRVSQLKVMKL
ncbi:MAG: polysaccharide deacetylase family protein [Marinoscillum sp.]|uniref:polysaccharide deacetylase family protein n=3 Tax=Marinoscillum sp. TaxID=2024838 RepID=UPI0032F21D8B